jgi:hypothetical protein
MSSARQLTREQTLALPPVISLGQLAETLGVSEPVIRECHRRGELEAAGIRVVHLGAQWRVVTASVWAVLGLVANASPAPGSADSPGQSKPSGPALRGTGQRNAGRGIRARESSSGA